MQKNTTKKAFLLSLASMLLCISMLVGSTFAWFTDTVTSGVNRIVAGNLDLEVSYWDGSKWASIQDVATLFDPNTLWEPGHTEYVTLKIENKGTLAFNYKAMVQPVNETGGINVNDDAFRLSDYLVFKTTKPTTSDSTPADRNAARALAGTEMKLNQAALTQTGYILSGGDAQYITLVIYMPETVGNEANYKTGTTPPKIELGITVFASQRTAESDSFGNEYDAIATFPDNLATIDAFTKTVTAADDSFTIGNAAGTVQASGNTNTGTEITLTFAPTVDDSASVVNAVASSGSAVAISYDIKVSGQTSGSAVTVEIYLGSGIVVNDFYHNGTAMTKVFDKDSLADGRYYFDETTGYLTFKTSTFSTFSAVVEKLVNWIQLADTSWYNDTDTTFTLTTANQLAGLAKLTNNGNNFSGKTIILGADIDLKGREWVPVGASNDYAGDWKSAVYFAGSFDGNGRTIKNLKVTSGEGENNIGLFGLIKVAEGVEIKNVVIDGATIKGSGQSTGALAGAMTAGAKWQSGVGLVPDACKNITVKNATVEGGKYTGGVIGYAQTNFDAITVENTKVSSIKNTHAEDSGENAGLVCGNLYDLFNAKNITIKNGEVFGFAKVGGVAGSSQNSHYIRDVTIDGLIVKLDPASPSDLYGSVSGRVGSINAPQYTGITVNNAVFKKGEDNLTAQQIKIV